MDVKEAVHKAIAYISDVFSSEKLENIGLEEIVYDEQRDVWEITIGFSRPWDYPMRGVLSELKPLPARRQYKVVHIDNSSGDVKSIRIREVKNA